MPISVASRCKNMKKSHETTSNPIHRSPANSSFASRSMNTHTPPVTVRLLDDAGTFGSPIQVPKIVKSDDAWRAQLADEQFRVTRTHDRERAFCGIFHDNHQHGGPIPRIGSAFNIS